MSCQTVREQFDHRLDGRLSGHEQAAFEVHLAGCADCRREWEAYASAWQVLARDEGIEPRVDIRQWWWRPSIRWATLATTVVALAVTARVGHERMLNKRHAELYARVQQGEYLEDYDVIANLDQLKGGNHE